MARGGDRRRGEDEDLAWVEMNDRETGDVGEGLAEGGGLSREHVIVFVAWACRCQSRDRRILAVALSIAICGRYCGPYEMARHSSSLTDGIF